MFILYSYTHKLYIVWHGSSYHLSWSGCSDGCHRIRRSGSGPWNCLIDWLMMIIDDRLKQIGQIFLKGASKSHYAWTIQNIPSQTGPLSEDFDPRLPGDRHPKLGKADGQWLGPGVVDHGHSKTSNTKTCKVLRLPCIGWGFLWFGSSHKPDKLVKVNPNPMILRSSRL